MPPLRKPVYILLQDLERADRLSGELAGFDFELLRDEHGWLRAQKKVFGLWFKDLGDLGRVQLDVVTVQGRQVLTARSHGQRLAIGERIDPPPLPLAWAATIGTYQVRNTHEPDAPLSGISVRLEEGFLVIRGQLQKSWPWSTVPSKWHVK